MEELSENASTISDQSSAIRHPKRGDVEQRFRFVLVTPVRNEEALIGRTIKSVLAQTILPSEWVIVSDGSTDRTDDIVREAQTENSWIQLISLPPREKASFAAVVENTTRGINSLKVQDYAFLGLLDSDVEFQTDYFERLMQEFHKNPKLGLAGGVAIDIGLPKDQFPRNREDVPGALQFFRRECYESLGGIIPIPEGGWDSLTCAVARKNGYDTRLITELVVDHLKPRNVSQGGALKRKWQMGVRDYAIGYHPLFELAKCASRVTRERPYFFASLAWGCGYFKSLFGRRKRVVPPEVVAFIRREQMQRLFRANG